MKRTVHQTTAGSEAAPDAVVALAEYCIETDYRKLPEMVVLATKNQILDTLGVALAGRGQPGAQQLADFTIEMAGKAEARIWGTNDWVPSQDAARVNATMSHALDYDDTHEQSFVHPSVITVPAALATADMLGNVSGQEAIAAVALGVDVACRLARSARPGVSGFEHGWHNTTLYGYFASAVVAGKLMGLTREQLISALGIAFHQISGNSQAHVDGALTKRLGPGFASYGGILSARLAQRGVQGATGVFEGSRGFFRQYHDNHYSQEILFSGLGRTFAGSEVAFKPWPSCRGSHTAADAALSIFALSDIEADHVDAITIFNGPGEFQLLAVPLAKKQHPGSVVDAQFSNPWVVAAALVDQKVGLEHFTPAAIQRTDLLAVTRRIKTIEDPSLIRPGGGPGPTRIDVLLKNGRRLSKTVEYAKGEPGHPMSSLEFQQKFLDCTQLAGMSADRAWKLLESVSQLETLADAGKLTSAAVI